MAFRIYELYPTGDGFSNHTEDYRGVAYTVAASSNKQAHFLAHREVWADGPDNPTGLLEIYRRGGSRPGLHRLWCKCDVYGGLNVRSGDGKKAIVAAMQAHVDAAHT